MTRAVLTRTLLALAGLAAGGVAILAIISLVNDSEGLACCTASAPLGWVVPLVAAGVIAAVGISLLSSGADSRGGTEFAAIPEILCESCGSPMAREWRLCPNCGRVFEGPGTGTDESPRSEKPTV
ncbi:MAG: zinc ribbon domain-containing protein [Actinobacteria bacterium]|nr:zinc ribbon domain-containing protein [Actinomycetota bacterium]MDP2232962.1 zinc ribbon domain-containing protein [Actinomycetota bacterium]